MKKRIVAALLLVAMAMSLVACGGSTTPEAKPAAPQAAAPQAGSTGNAGNATVGNFTVPEGGYDGSAVTIKFAHTMGAKLQEVLNYHIGEFNKLYPNITVEHNTYGGWSDIAGLINTEIMADNQPNSDC